MFIVLEGPDCAGKTTQIEMLANYLSESGVEYVVTREPGGTEFAEQLRTLFKTHSLSPSAQLHAVLAARIDHVEKVIQPALDAGKAVICDRFEMSTYVYQVLQEPSLERSFQEDVFVSEDPVYIVLSLPREVAQQRMSARGVADAPELAVANADLNDRYLRAAEYFDDCYVINAAQAPHSVHREIRDIVDNLL